MHYQADLRFHNVDYGRTQISMNLGEKEKYLPILNNIIANLCVFT